jgi:hypothetical protein
MSQTHLTTWLVMAIVLLAQVALAMPTALAVLLEGNVKQEVTLQPASLMLVEKGTGQPVYTAKVQWPELGQSVVGKATVTLPKACEAPQGCLMAVSAKGFQAKTMRFKAQKGQTHTLALEREQRSMTWVDNTIRLGDGTFSWQSAGANRLSQQGQLPQPTFSITLPLPATLLDTAKQQPFVWLELGEVYGLDTADAFNAGQSQAQVFASPLRVSINHSPVGHVVLNQRNPRFPVASSLLLRGAGRATLTLEAGYQGNPTLMVDYDDCSVVFVRWVW